jgi:DNA repair protein RecN (Recombination protein N)
LLSRLTVSNLAIIEKAEVEFGPSLNVITGETGSGKSVLMSALSLVVGARGDSSIVRDGAKEARLEACFQLSEATQAAVDAILSERGLEPCEEACLIIRRQISADGKSRIWINDSAATLSLLRELKALLVDFHGPRDNQAALDEGFQRDALDAFAAGGALGKAKAAYADAWGKLRALEGEMNALAATSERSVADELDMLRYQVDEIDGANLCGDDETLEERHAAAAHAGEIVETANKVTSLLGGDGGAGTVLAEVSAALCRMAKHCAEAEAWQEDAAEISVRIEELSRSVADLTSRLDFGDGDLEELDRRLTQVSRLKRKYATDVPGLVALADEKRSRIEALENRAVRIGELAREIEEAKKVVAQLGDALRRERERSGVRLGKAVTAELRDLGFLSSKFSVAVEAAAPSPDGCDSVAFMFEPNPGESARALSAIASSGETARVMLSLKSVLASHDGVDTLVFDEIDANIGGEVGKAVGVKMRNVAGHRQVVAITHLPQSAVYGDRHLVVSKDVDAGRTKVRIVQAEGEARVAEIARMLGGEELTSVVKRHAKELLQLSR